MRRRLSKRKPPTNQRWPREPNGLRMVRGSAGRISVARATPDALGSPPPDRRGISARFFSMSCMTFQNVAHFLASDPFERGGHHLDDLRRRIIDDLFAVCREADIELSPIPGREFAFSSPRFSMLSKAGTAVVEAIPTRLLSSADSSRHVRPARAGSTDARA